MKMDLQDDILQFGVFSGSLSCVKGLNVVYAKEG